MFPGHSRRARKLRKLERPAKNRVREKRQSGHRFEAGGNSVNGQTTGNSQRSNNYVGRLNRLEVLLEGPCETLPSLRMNETCGEFATSELRDSNFLTQLPYFYFFFRRDYHQSGCCSRAVSRRFQQLGNPARLGELFANGLRCQRERLQRTQKNMHLRPYLGIVRG